MDKKTKIEAMVVGVILLLTLVCYLRYEPINCPEMGLSCRYDRWTGNVEFTVWGDHWRPMRPPSGMAPSPEALAAEGK
jgi:hypothetical protein